MEWENGPPLKSTKQTNKQANKHEGKQNMKVSLCENGCYIYL